MRISGKRGPYTNLRAIFRSSPRLENCRTARRPSRRLTAHLTDAAHYGITLLLATGSDAHLASLRALAAERNIFKLEHCPRRGIVPNPRMGYG
jgi:hypothetical protein